MQSKSIDGNQHQRSVLTEGGAEHVLKHAFQPVVFQKWFCLTDSGPCVFAGNLTLKKKVVTGP